MAWCVLWFMACYFPCKVPCTAPTAHQLSDILWAELAQWHRMMGDQVSQLAQEYEWSSEKFALKSHPSESFAVARTSRPEKPEALQGFHSENILFLIDEAAGIAEKVFEVAEGALSTNGAFVVMAGNPTKEEGYFHASHHKMRDHWSTLHWNSEDSPLVSKTYVDSMRQKYGVDSQIYQVRVMGNFATAVDGVIPLNLCELAKDRDVKGIEADEIWGLDVARFGDDSTALAKRRGNIQVEPTQEWFGKDTMQVVGILKNEYDRARIKPVSINVDVIGIGAGVVDRGKEVGLPVRGVNVAESASANDKYSRLRDELWFKCREWLEGRDVKLADDDALIAELTTPKYTILSTGKIKVEGKDEMKRRGVQSPNRADAWNNTFALGTPKRHKPITYGNLGIV